MKTVLLCFTLVLVVYLAMNRQRVYLRDPLGTVYRNEVKQDDAWVFINYSNDVLVQSGVAPHAPEFLVQSWDRLPGMPMEMQCLMGVACLAQDNRARMQGWTGARTATMTNREVSFMDGDGTRVRVTLR